MSTYRLLKVILRAIGLYTLWRGIVTFIVFVGILAAPTFSGQMSGSVYLVLFTNFLTSLMFLLFTALVFFRIDQFLKFLGMDESEFEKHSLPFDQRVFITVIVIGGILIAMGGAHATELKFNFNTATTTGYITGEDPSTTITKSNDYNFSLFSFIQIIVGVLFLTRAHKVTDFLVNRFESRKSA
ncbi:hypothetical protein [Roseivirga misakiensis]|uniref:Uncharacterized protein n=1 Tax=Roseivirga misakiensis TaxID=1563681 RepID=A0A1E5SYP9_9BACT|nr:hypothetical protein [Roseivirga misakiensis]OEK04249.1 hypothetical protein BFP71_12255 [Roseivirga misakiensis]